MGLAETLLLQVQSMEGDGEQWPSVGGDDGTELSGASVLQSMLQCLAREQVLAQEREAVLIVRASTPDTISRGGTWAGGDLVSWNTTQQAGDQGGCAQMSTRGLQGHDASMRDAALEEGPQREWALVQECAGLHEEVG